MKHVKLEKVLNCQDYVIDYLCMLTLKYIYKWCIAFSSFLFIIEGGALFSFVSKLSWHQKCLHGGIWEMAREQQEISWLDSPCESHEEAGVEEHNSSHVFAYIFNWFIIIENSCSNNSPISNWTPEMSCLWSYWWVDEFH